MERKRNRVREEKERKMIREELRRKRESKIS